MPDSQHNLSQSRLTAGLLSGVVLALAGLLLAFVISFNLADHQYRLATLSERQANAVSQITELAAARVSRDDLGKALSQYRELIDEETALLAGDAKIVAHQRHEADEASRLEQLALASSDGSAFRDLAGRISRQEADEVVAARRELDRLHTRTVVLASALAGVALLCALGAAWLLVRRNRSLATLVQARTARIEAVDQSRRLFFAKASHELRTPVTAMRGEAEVALLNTDAPADYLRQSLSHILASTTFLSHRIDELLGLASADDGKLLLDFASLDLGEVVEQAAIEAETFARSVEVRIALAKPTAILARGDARWLRQALLTIIDNGLKYSPMGGELAIDLAVREQAAVITVSDRGSGVMPEDLPRIFDAYYQSEQDRQRGGNGLGLALARWVVEQHGGTIAAANRQEGGCRITIRLPLEAAQ